MRKRVDAARCWQFAVCCVCVHRHGRLVGGGSIRGHEGAPKAKRVYNIYVGGKSTEKSGNWRGEAELVNN